MAGFAGSLMSSGVGNVCGKAGLGGSASTGANFSSGSCSRGSSVVVGFGDMFDNIEGDNGIELAIFLP